VENGSSCSKITTGVPFGLNEHEPEEEIRSIGWEREAGSRKV